MLKFCKEKEELSPQLTMRYGEFGVKPGMRILVLGMM